jgi:two-component system sensor histidine kinase BaeS
VPAVLRSLRARLLIASMLVAVVSVGATAWLTTRGSGERLRDSVDRTLETDSDIYGRLIDYASTHPDWSGVDDLVAELSSDTGRRIALTTPRGQVIVDSARLQGHEGVPLPEKPAGVVDPFDVSGAGFVELDTATPGQVYEATPEEREERRALVEEGEACLRERGLEPDVYDEEDGLPQLSVTYSEDATQREMAAADLALDECADPHLFDPTAAEVAAVREIVRLEGECLDEAGVPYIVQTDETGQYVVLDRETDHDFEVDMACTARAERQAYDFRIADVANLYLGQRDRRGITLADAGSSRTLAAAGAVTVLALLVTVLASRRVLRPVAALTAAAQRMEAGDLTQRVNDRGRDELARLAHAFNSMADALAGHEQQRRRLASDVAHELRTPLANLRGYVEAAQDGVTPTDPALLSSLHEEALLLQRLVDDLQTLSLAESGRLPLALGTVDLGELAGQVVTAFRLTAEQAEVTLTAVVPDDAELTTEADPGRLRQVLGNLVANALRHTPPGGAVTVTVSASAAGLAVAVADTGAGIAPDHLAHVFDRFWRADESRTRDTGGSGLGLAISRQLVEIHGGTLTVDSTLLEGTTFTLTLPSTSTGPVPQHPQA